jgi:linoleoyl-CoA desaturase
MIKKKSLTFASTHRDFSATLNKRVNEYFKNQRLSKHANTEMVVKTICMFLGYIGPYFLIITNVITGPVGLLASVFIMSLGLAGIGLSVMHDANHGAYAKRNWINNVLGYSMNLIGANAFNWKVQHNIMHHSFTNVHDEDEDISPRGALRLSPHTKWKRLHRYQFIYAWFLYGLMTIVWLFFKDFVRLITYHKIGMVKRQNADVKREWIILIGSKLVYVGYIFFLPLAFTSLSWWTILLGVFSMHYIAGFILAIIFQPAHVIEGTSYPLPDHDRHLENNWAIHQLLTTSNFGNNSRWFTWYVGALNFQIEHHLFPGICHVHYRKIAGLVKQTAHEFNLPYRSSRTFLSALISHMRILKQLGTRPV